MDMLHKDYFGKEVQVGDTIIRSVHGMLEERKVLKIYKSALSLERVKNDRYMAHFWLNKGDEEVSFSDIPDEFKSCSYNSPFKKLNGKYYKKAERKPLYWRFYNNNFIILNK